MIGGDKAKGERIAVKDLRKREEVSKLTDTPYLNLYQIKTEDRKGEELNYYFASRREKGALKINTGENEPEGVTVFAVTRECPRRLLLIEEYRYPLGKAVYDVPAGMIDPGEDGSRAAIREVREETGMCLEICQGMEAFSENAAFMTPGMTDESNVTFFGYVTGEADSRYQEDEEDIQVRFLGKDQVRRVIRQESITARALYAMMLFLMMDEAEPYGAFLR